jgi:hypothetical protein
VYRRGGDVGERLVVVANRRPRGAGRGLPEGAVVGILVLAVVGVAVATILVRPPASSERAQPPMFPAPPETAQLAADASAQSSARNAVAAALTAYTDLQTFRGLTEDDLRQIEPDLAFTSTPSAGPDAPSVAFTPSAVGIAVRSTAGGCFWLRVSGRGRTAYGQGEPCTGAAAFGATGSSWS